MIFETFDHIKSYIKTQYDLM